MKKLFILFVTLLMLCSPIVLAEDATVVEDETADIIEEETEVDAGSTPDSPLWGLDRAMERIELALTFGKAAKAKKGLEHARERLAEVKAMAEARKVKHAEKAKEKYKEALEEAQKNIDEISVDAPEENLDTVVDFEKDLDDLDEQAEKIKELVRVKVKGELTEEQQAELDSLVTELKASGERARIRFDAKKDKAVIKYKTALKKTDAEVQEKLKELTTKRLQIKVDKMKEITEKAKEKGRDVSVIEKRIADAEGLILELDLSETPKVASKRIQKLLNFRREKVKAEEPVEEPEDKTSATPEETESEEDQETGEDEDSEEDESEETAGN